MKFYFIILLSILLLFTSNAYSQSKKEQIDILTVRIDSLNTALTYHVRKSIENQTAINEVNSKINLMDNQLNTINTQVLNFNSELLQIKQSFDKNEVAVGEQQIKINELDIKIAKLESDLQLLNDEKILLQEELDKLKQSKISASSEKNNQINSTSTFKSVKIGTQIWMSENLNVDRFRNGDPIPEVKTNEEWMKAGENKQPAWCYYDNDKKNETKYGKLYNWYAVSDPRGLAPAGWHVSTNEDWINLYTELGGEEITGNKLKKPNVWVECNNDVKNEFGFSALPAGNRGHNDNISGESFSSPGDQYGFFYQSMYAFFWTSQQAEDKFSVFYTIDCDVLASRQYGPKEAGFSVRCVKD